MHAFIIVGLSAFLLCLFLTPICRDLAQHFGFVDKPDRERKLHHRAVPRIGGLPIAVSYASALAVYFWLNPGGGKIYIQHHQLFHALLPAALLIFATGLLDDLIGLRPWQKLAGQVAASVLAVTFGVHLKITHTPDWISNTLSVLWLIGCSNAVNLIDGMDGLATGIGLLATLTTVLVAFLTGNVGLALATIPLAGCLLAFLRYNFSPASVFLGDCGSLTIGFVLGCFGLTWSQKTGNLLGIISPLMLLALPLVDVGLAIGRRFLRDVPIFSADRSHIHHKILGFGFSARRTAILLYGVCILSAALAVLESFSPSNFRWVIPVVFLLLIILGVKRLKYIEFSAAKKTLSHRRIRRAVQDEIMIHELSRALADAETLEDWWDIACDACQETDFASAQLEFEDHAFSRHFISSFGKPACRIHLSLGEHGLLLLTRMREPEMPRSAMAVVSCLHVSFEQRLTHSTDGDIPGQDHALTDAAVRATSTHAA